MSYFNTTHLDGPDLRAALRAAEGQDEVVLAIFRMARSPMSPSHAHAVTQAMGRRWPLTSIRRSVTNLTKDGKLERLDRKQMGPFGRPEYLWKLAEVAL